MIKKNIGSRFIISFDGTELDETTISLIENYHIGGIILNSNNVLNFSHLEALIGLIKSYADYNILIGIDFFSFDESHPIFQRVYNIPHPLALVATNDADYIYKYADILSKNIKLSYSNLDTVINGNIPAKNMDYNRFSFGSDVQKVEKHVKEYISIVSEADIITTISDFPGRGKTQLVGNRNINYSTISELLKNDILPFKKASENNVDIIFLNNDIYNEIEKDIPASLSSNMINLMKSEINNEMVIIGSKPIDDFIINKLKIEDIITKSFNAGVETIYMPRYYEKLSEIIDKLEKNTKISSLINASQYKFDFLQKKIELADDIININETEDVILNTFSEQIAEESISILKNNDSIVPLQLEEFDILGVVEPEIITKQYLLDGAQKDIFSFTQYLKDNHRSIYQIIPGDDTNWDEFKTVIYCIDNESSFTLDYLKQLEDLKINIILVFTNEPKIYNFYKKIDSKAVIFTYGFSDAVRRGLTNILFNKYSPKSIFPLDL